MGLYKSAKQLIGQLLHSQNESQLVGFADIPVDISEPVIKVAEPEVNDAPERSRLYREYEPDFEKSHERGLKVLRRWARRYGFHITGDTQ